MNKNIVLALVLLSFFGCSDKEPSPEAVEKKAVDVNKTEVKKIDSKKTEVIKTEVENEVPADFVPEHIRKSKIEVVKHY